MWYESAGMWQPPARIKHELPSGKAKAKVVLSLVKGAKPRSDGRPDGSVDLVIGETFTGLVKITAPAPATSPASPSTPTC